MESCIPDTRRTIRANRNVLWAHELARDLPNDDEYHLPYRGCPRMALCIHGQHCNPHQMRERRNRAATSRTPSAIYTPHAPQTGTKRPIPKTRKMRLREKG